MRARPNVAGSNTARVSKRPRSCGDQSGRTPATSSEDADDSVLGRRWWLATLTMNRADNKFVWRGRRRQRPICRDSKLLLEMNQVTFELPVGVAPRQDDVSAPLRPSYRLRNGAKCRA